MQTMRTLHAILVLLLVLTPISQAFAGSALHSCDGPAATGNSEAHGAHAGHGVDHGMGSDESAIHVTSDTPVTDTGCECGCICSAGHACQGSAVIPMLAGDQPPPSRGAVSAMLDSHSSSAFLAVDLRPPITRSH